MVRVRVVYSTQLEACRHLDSKKCEVVKFVDSSKRGKLLSALHV